jgi:hypothetical protein
MHQRSVRCCEIAESTWLYQPAAIMVVAALYAVARNQCRGSFAAQEQLDGQFMFQQLSKCGSYDAASSTQILLADAAVRRY